MKQKELFKFKVFDTLNHYLLNAKLEVYGLSAKSYSYIHSHLNKRLQKTNISFDFNLWKEIQQEFLKDLFLFHLYSIYEYQ